MDYSISYQDEDNYNNQLLTSPADDLYGLSPWSSTNLTKDLYEEVLNQPERGIAGFVSKLYQCLDESTEGPKYARWCKHNGIDMFIIDCIPKFTEIVLPKLFKHCKFASFVRQLNIYGFQRDTDARKSKDSKDKETCRWHHIYFRPGRRDLFHLIRRKTPRYSRRKRQRPEEEDPETILNVGSGDESDNKDNDDETNSRQSSASPNIIPQTTTVNLLEFDTQSQQQETQSQQIDFNQLFGQTNVTITYPPSIISPTTEIDKNSFNPTFHAAASNTTRLPTNDDYLQTMAQTEEGLCSQIVELRKGYTRMCRILTEEINKAFNVIHAQRARIELLESTLHQNYFPNQQQFTPTATTTTTTTTNNSNSNNNNHQTVAFKQQENFLPYSTTSMMPGNKNETSSSLAFRNDH